MSGDQAEAVAAEGGSNEKPKRSRALHIREKIRAAVILERLERQALGELEPPMTKDQITAAQIVLKKVIPDLQAMTVSGDADADPVQVLQRIERVLVK
jgi:hypothetical protein